MIVGRQAGGHEDPAADDRSTHNAVSETGPEYTPETVCRSPSPLREA